MDEQKITPEQRLLEHQILIKNAVASRDLQSLLSSVQALSSQIVQNDNLGLVLSRQLIANLASEIQNASFPPETAISLYSTLLSALQDRITSYDEPVSTIRELLANIYEDQEEYRLSAQCLQQISMDTSYRVVPLTYRLGIYNRIVRLYLEDQDHVSAETYLNRMAVLMHECDDKLLNLQFKASQARMFDFKRQFLNAANKYLELSRVNEMDICEQMFLLPWHKRLITRDALGKAIICAILSGAGPQRTKMLSQLYADERVRLHTEFQKNSLYAILESTYLERLLIKEQVENFSLALGSHHLALLADGSTVLQKSVTEHNLLATSKLYENITFESLGKILDTSPEKAETVARKMIQEKRLKAVLDQVEGILLFTDEEFEQDDGIADICNQIDSIYQAMTTS